MKRWQVCFTNQHDAKPAIFMLIIIKEDILALLNPIYVDGTRVGSYLTIGTQYYSIKLDISHCRRYPRAPAPAHK